MNNALVLGGGGPVGASWMSALLHGLVSAGVPLAESDVVLGTSAGAILGAWLTTRPADLLSVTGAVRKRAASHAENAKSGRIDMSLLQRVTTRIAQGTDTVLSIAQAAVTAIPPISADEADAMSKATVPEGPWSPRLRMASVNTGTGLVHLWSAQDEISMAVGVSCSTALPGVAPAVRVAESFWVDGGVRSGTNADLLVETDDGGEAPFATGPGSVLVVAPLPAGDLEREEAALVEHGHRVRVITAVPFYTATTDLLDPAFIDVGATAGAGQAADLAADLRTWWRA